MSEQGRVEIGSSRRVPRSPSAPSRAEHRGTLDTLVDQIDAGRDVRKLGPAFRAGGLVRRMRREAGLSQYELADRIGVSQARVSEIESGFGVQGPTWDLIERIADACGREVGLLPTTGDAVAGKRRRRSIDRGRHEPSAQSG